MKRLAVVAAVSLAAILLMAQMQAAPAEVRTQNLVLVDKAGRVRATFSASAGPLDATMLVFRTPKNEGRIHMALMASGDAMITIDDAKGARVMMTLNGSDAGVIVYDSKGKGIHGFSAR